MGLINSAITILVAAAMVAAVSLLIAFPVMWCWNYAVVAVFGLPVVTWGQAWCLLFIANAAFKSTK